jgi:hypothetical protein
MNQLEAVCHCLQTRCTVAARSQARCSTPTSHSPAPNCHLSWEQLTPIACSWLVLSAEHGPTHLAHRPAELDQSTCWTFGNILSVCKVVKQPTGKLANMSRRHTTRMHLLPQFDWWLKRMCKCEVKGLPILLVKPPVGLKTTVQFKSWLTQESCLCRERHGS